MSISSIGSNIIGKITNFKPVKKCCEYYDKNPAKALALGTIGSVIAKDGVGCYMYVTQSLHNKEIPEEKRKFVAAYDLTNGVLMMATQVLCFFAMRKINQSLFPKLFKKSFDSKGKVIKSVATQLRKNQKDAGLDPARKSVIKKVYNSIKGHSYDIFSFITELAAATIFAKRIVVPLISTPLANKVKGKMGKASSSKSPEKPEDKKEENVKEKNTAEAKDKVTQFNGTESNLLKRINSNP